MTEMQMVPLILFSGPHGRQSLSRGMISDSLAVLRAESKIRAGLTAFAKKY